jgi:hypothetical protein
MLNLSSVEMVILDSEGSFCLVPSGDTDHRGRPVDSDDLCPSSGKDSRESALTAPEIQDPKTSHRAEGPQECRAMDTVPSVVFPRLLEILPDVDGILPGPTRIPWMDPAIRRSLGHGL